MKGLFLIPAICLACFSCHNDRNNDTVAQSQESSSDWTITGKVKTAIMTDSRLSNDARMISVSTTNGVVTLKGTVRSRRDREQLIEIAKNVSGVVSVKNEIDVK